MDMKDAGKLPRLIRNIVRRLRELESKLNIPEANSVVEDDNDLNK